MVNTDSGKIRVTNKGVAPRVIHDKEGKMFSILPGASAVLFVSERQERDLRASPVLDVTSTEEHVTRRVPNEELNKPQPVVKKEEKPQSDKLTAQQLLDRMDDLTYPELLAASKVTLGDEFPTGSAGGNPKKAELVRIIRRAAKQEAESKED